VRAGIHGTSRRGRGRGLALGPELGAAGDFVWSAAAIRQYFLDRRFTVLLSSVFGLVSPRDLAEWLLSSRLDVRMQLQLHKFIWEPDARGV
jgi:7-carboxy-7-deazaguanine synthase